MVKHFEKKKHYFILNKNGHTDVPAMVLELLFTRYLYAKGLIPESLSPIGQF